MRSETLLFFHVLVGMALVGGLVATTVTSLAAARLVGPQADALRSVGRWTAAATALAAIATVALGEGLASDENASGAWLDVSRGLATFGLLVGGVVLAILAWLAPSRPGLTRFAGLLGALLALVALAVAFVMAAKPG